MSAQRSYFDYLKAAFHVRYPVKGMGEIPINYLAMGGAILAGLWQWPLFLVGAGIEATFLTLLAGNPRFQRYVDQSATRQSSQSFKANVEDMLRGLTHRDRKRYRTLENRCQTVSKMLQTLPGQGGGVKRMTFQNINSLLWIYLRLLTQKNMIEQYVETRAQAESEIRMEIQDSEAKLEKIQGSATLLRKSLEGTVDLLKRRLDNVIHAKDKLNYLQAELNRIDQQVEWIIEETALSENDNTLSERIDSVALTLNDTNEWMRLNTDFAVTSEFAVPDMLSETRRLRRLLSD